MKKLLLSMLALLLMTQCLFAQHYTVNRSDYNAIDLTFTPSRIQSKVISTPAGEFTKISMDDYLPAVKVGCPAIPVMTRLLEIPLCEEVVATVTSSSYEEYDAAELGITAPIYPAQQAYPKSYRGEKTFSKDQSVYSRNAFYGQPLVSVEKVGVMRDVNLASIEVSPVSYNPVTNKVRVYTEVNVEVSFVNANVPGTLEMKAKYGSPMFQSAKAAVINPMQSTRDEYHGTPIKYLIVAHSMFEGNANLTNFVNWKKRMGYIVEVAYTSTIGTTNTAIQNYIKAEYTNATETNPAPTFILIIGDHQQIPAFSSTEENSHVTDLYYATWTSGDNIPDCYYGRWSAQTVAQLEPQIEKALMYEQYTMEDPSYLGKAVLIAGTDNSWSPTHANGQINYVYNNYINTSNTEHNYTTVYEHLHNCSSQAATIRSEIGAGVGWANYTAHGAETEWYEPNFPASAVSSMNNRHKYGLMIGNCCLTGKFNYSSDCFAEVLLRTADKGAMAYIGGSEVTYWDEDVYWAVGVRNNISANLSYDASALGAYDRIFHQHNEDHANWTSTIGGFMTGGNLSVQSSNSSMKKYYWEIYHCFGDPSIRLYLGIPNTMNVSSSDVITVGATSYQLQAAPYAYCALTHNGELVGAAFADALGNAEITFPALQTPGEYELACGAQNYIQYFRTITVIVPEGAYVVATDFDLNPTSQPCNGFTVNYDLVLKNLGVSAASNITATLTTTSPLATITQATATQSSLAVDAMATLNNAFTVVISPDAQDGDIIPLTVTINWGAGSSSKVLNQTVLAPKLEVVDHTIAPVGGGTAIAPGDEVTVDVEIKNVGHAQVVEALTDLTCNYSGVVVTSSSLTMQALQPSTSTINHFTLQVASTVPDNSIVPLYYHTIMGSTSSIDTFYVTIGNAMETFETGDFSAFSWSNSGNNAWTVTNASPYAGSYCARSKQSLSNSATSTMQITMTALMDGNISFFRKVSSEASYDKFKFYIDGNQMEEQSGTVAWSQASFPVTAGTHTYKFSYSKDYSQASGSDCAWVDNILFPGIGTMVVEDIVDQIGVEDYNQDRVGLYPNPTTSQVTVTSTKSIQTVELYDLSGRMLDRMSVNGTQATVNVSHLANGVYFAKIYTEDQKATVSKFIKQ